MKKLTIQDNERTLIVVFGDDAVKNKQLFTAAIRMPGLPRIVVIGEITPDIERYREISGPDSCEIWPIETELPSLGKNTMLLDGRAKSAKS